MKINQLMPIIKEVLLNPFIIGTTIVIILYLNFISYIVRYRKKPPKIKVKKIQDIPAPQPKQDNENESDEDDE